VATSSPPRVEVYNSTYWRLEPTENLEKLFILSGCTLNTQIIPISELEGILTNLITCGISDNDNYLNWVNENNETAFEIAIKAGNTVMVELLLKKGGKDIMNSDGFRIACRMGRKKIVKILLESDAHSNLDVHMQTDCVINCTKHGYNHLLIMLYNAGFLLSNYDKFVELKLPEGSIVPKLWKRRTNGSLLHIAAGNGHHEII